MTELFDIVAQEIVKTVHGLKARIKNVPDYLEGLVVGETVEIISSRLIEAEHLNEEQVEILRGDDTWFILLNDLDVQL